MTQFAAPSRLLALVATAVLGLVLAGGLPAPGPATATAAAATKAKVKAQPKLRPGLAIGIADQKLAMFSDPKFLQLGLHKVRRVVPWDAMSVDFETPEVDAWIAAARLAKVRPLISFGHSRVEGQRRVAPSPARLVEEFRKFRERYPEVKEFATWNEPNLCGEPLCHKPELAARYYDALTAECPSCTILAAEVLDGPTMKKWVTAFMRHVKRTPKVWGVHNYVDANRLQTTGTSDLLKLVKGDLWFTETGGIVKRRTTKNKLVGFPETAAHAGLAVRWIFDRLVPLSPRIKRVYLYNWNSGGPLDSWDSALFDHTGKARPAFRVLQNRVDRLAVARRALAARRR
ncbi:hypothetical protein DSM112329_01593 [Paraconexibacter sp. AEG42_29]|uniref:Asl1-like glycosyl hydrolase catalytic domain-containing protein n=1 Tax=Paraconexibacter sp. AEG42_29 TaxID=2997339 RepID=A0AAU7AST1_9ACTN